MSSCRGRCLRPRNAKVKFLPAFLPPTRGMHPARPTPLVLVGPPKPQSTDEFPKQWSVELKKVPPELERFEFLHNKSDSSTRTLPVRSSHTFRGDSAAFDDDNLVSCAGLVPIMALARQTQLMDLLADKVAITTPKIASGAANPAPKLKTLIAAMCAGADSIDDIDLLRSGGMKHLFGNLYAPSTVGTLLREFTFGHNRQLKSVLREHLVALVDRADILPGNADRAFIDIDSLLRPVYGHTKSPENRSSAKGSPHSRRSSVPPNQPRRRRDAAASRQSRIRQRCSPDGHPSHRHSTHGRRHWHDHGPR
jgi:hypothetical protein